MSEYRTARLCHQINKLEPGQKGSKGTNLGKMSNIGTQHAHVHADIGIGINRYQSLSKLASGEIQPDEKLVYEFCNWNLFKYKPVIRTYFMEPGYKDKRGVEHPAIDGVPEDRHETDEHFDIYWPLNCDFEILATGIYNDGNSYMIIWFEWSEDMELDYNEKAPKKIYIPNSGEILQLDKDWQWDALADSLDMLDDDSDILNKETWEEKARRKELTIDELTWLNTIMISRLLENMKGER